ncbi:MAG: hypothetical protein ACE5FU_05645 [Nitrospinota bacterium]
MNRLCRFLLFGCLLCVSCSGTWDNSRRDETGIRLVNGKPFWFFNPNKGGKAGGVGVSGRHVSGKNAQRKLAIQRAIDDLARQMNVKVSSVVRASSVATQTTESSILSSYSIQTVNGQTVKARIVEFWEDLETDELYVWMVLQ